MADVAIAPSLKDGSPAAAPGAPASAHPAPAMDEKPVAPVATTPVQPKADVHPHNNGEALKKYFLPQGNFLDFSAVGNAFGQAVEGISALGDWNETGTEEWKFGLFDFPKDIVLSLYMLCCCSQCAVVSHNGSHMSGITCEASFWANVATACVCCLGPFYQGHQRTALRKKYNLKGSPGQDCLLSCLCFTAPCAECQEAHELGYREDYHIPYTTVGHDSLGATKAPMPAKEMAR